MALQVNTSADAKLTEWLAQLSLTNEQSQSPFFKISAEVRNRIYEYVLVQEDPIVVCGGDTEAGHDPFCPTYAVRTKVNFELLMVNKQISNEAAPMAYGMNTFCVDRSCFKDDAKFDGDKWLKTIGSMRKFIINFKMNHHEDVGIHESTTRTLRLLKDSPKLKSVTLEHTMACQLGPAGRVIYINEDAYDVTGDRPLLNEQIAAAFGLVWGLKEVQRRAGVVNPKLNLFKVVGEVPGNGLCKRCDKKVVDVLTCGQLRVSWGHCTAECKNAEKHFEELGKMINGYLDRNTQGGNGGWLGEIF